MTPPPPKTDLSALRRWVEDESRMPLGAVTKGVPPELAATAQRDAARTPIPLHAMPTPFATLDRGRMRNNIAAMAAWTASRGIELQPHGKTSMSPEIWLRQLEAGATGITVANAAQLRVAVAAGVPAIQLANMVADEAAVRWIATQLVAQPDLELLVWVDSTEAADLLESALRDTGEDVRLKVLLEIGISGGRTGVRSEETAHRTAERVVAASHLDLVGVAGYEGIARADPARGEFGPVDAFLARMREAFQRLLPAFAAERPIITAGGSTYFDRVVAAFDPLFGETPDGRIPRIILRSGAYVAHDDAYYAQAYPHTRQVGPALDAALHVWGRVVSRPERTLAYLDLGKRDVGSDIALPVVETVLMRSGDPSPVQVPLPGHRAIALNDQHLGIEVPEDSPLRVGDLVRVGIAHPCTTFDRWQAIAVVEDVEDPEPSACGFIRTYF